MTIHPTRAGALASILAALALASTAHAEGGVYQEAGGLLVIEMESAPLVDDWELRTDCPGYTQDGYLEWRGPDLFNSPGAQGVFSFDFEVTNGGTFELGLRNRHEHPDPTEENDVWIKMDDGPWIKVFSNMPGSVGAWTWESRFDFGHGNQPQGSYDLDPGVHTIQFSGRSFGFKMDRVHLFHPGHPDGNDEGQPESLCRIGETACSQNPNSTGQISCISAVGSTSVADNNLLLRCGCLPTSTPGYFLVSDQSGFFANPGGSAGNICLGGDVGRYLFTVLDSGTAGEVAMRVDLTDVPSSSGPFAVAPGQTIHFQYWHRDSDAMGNPTSNFSRRLEIDFE